MAEFRTDYKDQLLDSSVNTKRKYDLVDESGNVVAQNVSLEDKTAYSQNGDTFGAAEVNKIHEELNGLNESLGNINIYVGGDEKLHFVDKDGADSVLPFKSKSTVKFTVARTPDANHVTQTVSVKLTDENGKVLYSKNLPDGWWQNSSSLSGSVTL